MDKPTAEALADRLREVEQIAAFAYGMLANGKAEEAKRELLKVFPIHADTHRP